MPSIPTPADRHQSLPSTPSTVFERRVVPRSLHKRVGSDEIKAVGTQFPEHSSYPDILDLGEDATIPRQSDSEPRRVASEPPVLYFRSYGGLDPYGVPVPTPSPELTEIQRGPYITQADFEELQRQRLHKRKRTHSSGDTTERSEHTYSHARGNSPSTTVDNASTNGNTAGSRHQTPFSDGHTPSHRSVDTDGRRG